VVFLWSNSPQALSLQVQWQDRMYRPAHLCNKYLASFQLLQGYFVSVSRFSCTTQKSQKIMQWLLKCDDLFGIICAGSPDLWLFSVEILLISDHKKWHYTFSYILNPKFFPRNLTYLVQGASVSARRSLYPRDNHCSETEGESCWVCIGSFRISDRFCTNTV